MVLELEQLPIPEQAIQQIVKAANDVGYSRDDLVTELERESKWYKDYCVRTTDGEYALYITVKKT